MAEGAEGLRAGRGEGAECACEAEVLGEVTRRAREWGRERPSPGTAASFFCNDPGPGEWPGRECGPDRPDHLSRDPRCPAPPPSPASPSSIVPLLMPGRDPRGPRLPRKALWHRCREPGPGPGPLREEREELRELLGDSLGWWGRAWRTPFLRGVGEGLVAVVVVVREPLFLWRPRCGVGDGTCCWGNGPTGEVKGAWG